jgi:hypothetical protein
MPSQKVDDEKTLSLPDTQGDPIADALIERLQVLMSDLNPNEHFPEVRPLLAHYTSVDVLELILKNGEVWLSNPLFMNDTQEIRFGMFEGMSIFRSAAKALRDACRDERLFTAIVAAFDHYANDFIEKGALDVYLFCLSEHLPNDRDGRLSMWRGYGADGNGAAIVFDTGKASYVEESPLLLVKVRYEDYDRQRERLKGYVDQFIDVVRDAEIPPSHGYVASWMLFRRFVYFSVMTKHIGFQEEQEWRLAYLPMSEEDTFLLELVDYWIGPRGVEPKLKLPLGPVPRVLAADFDLGKIIERIILGPTISNPLSHASISKMLQRLGRNELVERLWVSNIPFRSMRR